MFDDLLVCPVCRSRISYQDEQLNCSSCNTLYPVIGNKLPVLMSDPKLVLAQAYMQYERHLSDRNAELQALSTRLKHGYDRPLKTLDKLSEAYRTNNALIEEITEIIRPYVSLVSLRNMILSERVGKQGYMVSFAYMIRDWAGLEGGESEIKAITQQLVRSINQKFEEIDRSVPMLFLGAGMGRIASEVSAQIGTKVFAVDNSLTMAHLFGKISRQDVRFFEINLKNAMGASDIVVEHSASMTVLKNRPSNVQFLIGDATQLPFDNQSISCVVSVFFTDVVPLPMLIKELKRVLKPGGLFIHFGPLEYHHEDVRFMYSLEEILSIFENQGFATTSPKNFTLPHCRTSSTGLFKTYRCWLFEAEKNMPIQKIASSTVISIAKEIDFVQNGSIGPNFYNTQSSIALGVNDVYEGAETIIDILKILLTPKTFDELIQIMSLDYGGIDLPQVEQIKRVLLDLAYKGMLNLGDQTNQR